MAAILVAQDEPAVILIRRPIKQGDPWSGDMCFPGGRKELRDNNSFATALRETREEVGIDLQRQGAFLGRLSDVLTRAHETKPMVVSPYVFSITSAQQLTLSEEAQEIITVPLAFLANAGNRETLRWRVGPASLRMPCYYYQGARIWGMTLIMLDELVRIAGGGIPFADNWFRLFGLRH